MARTMEPQVEQIVMAVTEISMEVVIKLVLITQ